MNTAGLVEVVVVARTVADTVLVGTTLESADEVDEMKIGHAVVVDGGSGKIAAVEWTDTVVAVGLHSGNPKVTRLLNGGLSV